MSRAHRTKKDKKEMSHFERFVTEGNEKALSLQRVVGGQSSSSLVLSVIKTEVPLDCDDPANQDLLLQNSMENELKSCHNKKNCVNFVWMQDFWMLLKSDSISWRRTLEISHNFMQWPVVNTLFQEKTKHHNRKAGSMETPKLGPYWKLQPVICTVSMELRSEFWSVNRDNTHSWVRISRGSNKFVMNLNNETGIPEDQLEEYA